MKLSAAGEKYADTLSFNKARLLHEEAEKNLRTEPFKGFEDLSQRDFSFQIKTTAEIAKVRMESYVTAYEIEGLRIEHEDLIEFILRAKETIRQRAGQTQSKGKGVITMARNNWPESYRKQMLEHFENKAFNLLEPTINELNLKVKEADLKARQRENMIKRKDLFGWIYEQTGGQRYHDALLEEYLADHPDWTRADLTAASDFFEGEGLIEQKDDSGMLIWLTHEGVKAGSSDSDTMMGKPRLPVVQHTRNINNFNGPVGAFQQGDQNTANVVQTFGTDISEVAALLAQLRELFVPEHRESGLEYVDALEDELQKKEPKESRLRLFLRGAGGFATEAGKAVVGEIAKKLMSGDISI